MAVLGTLAALSSTCLLYTSCQAFFDEEYELAAGEHIKPEDKNKILISKALAEQNHLAVGDKINPVSYTHLDVYKRQQVGSVVDCPELELFEGTLPVDEELKNSTNRCV